MKEIKAPFLTKKQIVNWFGNRGEEIKSSWIKDWFVRDNLLYIQWNSIAATYFKADPPFDATYMNWKSLYYEIEDECCFDKEKSYERD